MVGGPQVPFLGVEVFVEERAEERLVFEVALRRPLSRAKRLRVTFG